MIVFKRILKLTFIKIDLFIVYRYYNIRRKIFEKTLFKALVTKISSNETLVIQNVVTFILVHFEFSYFARKEVVKEYGRYATGSFMGSS